MVPMVEAVAVEDPQIAPNMALAPMVAQATEPGTRDSHLRQKSYSPWLKPAAKQALPIKVNSGMTEKEYFIA